MSNDYSKNSSPKKPGTSTQTPSPNHPDARRPVSSQKPGQSQPSQRPAGPPRPGGNTAGSTPNGQSNQNRNNTSQRGPSSAASSGGGSSRGGYRSGGGGGNNRSRPQGNKGRSGGSSRSSSAPAVAEAPRVKEPVITITEIIIPTQITVRELAEKMHRSPIDIIKTLMNYGMMVPITESIDFSTAAVVGEELGITVKPEAAPEPEVSEAEEETPLTLRQRIMADENPAGLVLRPPIVTVLGHVDHGKTTLLDAIRETRVVEGEAGGITQHIAAYQVEIKNRKITFLDTPGHEAFTAMRARGAMVTDIAILVVAADDGVMPQTKEAIAHVKAAQVPIVVALNKIDKANANQDRVKQELADNGLLIEEYGGDVMCVPISAKMRRGIDDLLENILLVADIDPLMANPKGHTVGTVIEGRLDKTRGPLATLLVQNGALHVGDSIVTGETYGKLRAMYNDKGENITAALPATPVIVLGMSEVPVAGDTFSVEADDRTARAIAAERQANRRAAAAVTAGPKPMTLESILAHAEAGQIKELNLILKADVQGSIEPIVNSLEKLNSDKMRVKILHQATGNITESDVMLAIASHALIMGFSVNVEPAAARMADAEGIDIRLYDIIYKLVEDIERALTGLLDPVYKEVITGHAEVRAVFRVSKVGKVAGCYVLDGDIRRNALARVKRAGAVLAEDRIVGLKRFQEDTTEVKTGFECGITLGNYHDFEEGDIFEVYKKERVS